MRFPCSDIGAARLARAGRRGRRPSLLPRTRTFTIIFWQPVAQPGHRPVPRVQTTTRVRDLGFRPVRLLGYLLLYRLTKMCRSNNIES